MTRRPPGQPTDPDSSQAAYVSEAQVRMRLARRGFSVLAITPAIERLTGTRALDDRRAALAAARTDANIYHRGPARVLRRLHEMGIDRDLAHATVGEVFGEFDERALMERALAKRLRTGANAILDLAQLRRLHAYLVRQGFSSSAAATLLRSRTRRSAPPDDE
jgi:SOS response regulatory protein OraA/RecX